VHPYTTGSRTTLAEQTQLLTGCKMNQSDSLGFLFHLIDVSASNEFTVEKKMYLTIFAHHK
jgi:hypothetical protein